MDVSDRGVKAAAAGRHAPGAALLGARAQPGAKALPRTSRRCLRPVLTGRPG
jgi:hypothetical protein